MHSICKAPNLSLITSDKTLRDVSEVATEKRNATGFEVKLSADEKILRVLIWVPDSTSAERTAGFPRRGPDVLEWGQYGKS